MYKVGEKRWFPIKDDNGLGFEVGSLVEIFNEGKIIAKYVVLEREQDLVKGKIITTYGNKRRK